ncbi:hypothetical protein DDE74_31460 [Streptomyces lydicus]|uniref:Uncharacterized protein n=1 Tax=Streptomyces lydicus TaxID=47763 RepID=A0A3S9YIL5_9ACTN|nr:hypothetical protein DDE74_31460 [Streptomyces lydicus]
MNGGQRPQVGDEVEYALGRRAIVTDIRNGVLYLRVAGRREWPAENSDSLSVIRTRSQRIADDDVW